MDVRLLGSAAAEGWPALFCECPACEEARRRGGPNLRRRTAYAVNDDTLVDFGPDMHWQVTEFGIDLARTNHIIFTHSHGDHLSPLEFCWRRTGYSVVTRDLNIYGNEQVLSRISEQISADWQRYRLQPHTVRPFEPFVAGRLRVFPVEAQHAGPEEHALNYVISDGDRSVLIANDTGWWEEPTWQALKGFSFDAAILECTYVHREPNARLYHLGTDAVLAVKKELEHLGCIRSTTRVLVNHFSHNGFTLHEELCDFFAPHGIEVGFDGMLLRI